jgi:hypothetical protein
MKIATVQSFTNPDKTYAITREGKRMDQPGGQGTTWKCSCPAHTRRPSFPCKHLLACFAIGRTKEVPKEFVITADGKRILKLEMEQTALKLG